MLGASNKVVDAIERVRALVRESKEEEVVCYALDLFSLEQDVSGTR
jgi:hypothetical protein